MLDYVKMKKTCLSKGIMMVVYKQLHSGGIYLKYTRWPKDNPETKWQQICSNFSIWAKEGSTKWQQIWTNISQRGSPTGG